MLNNIKNVDKNILIKLYKCFGRPVLECASEVYLARNIGLIDLVEIVHKDYMECIIFVMLINLNCDNLEFLELHCVYADLTMLNKILDESINKS